MPPSSPNPIPSAAPWKALYPFQSQELRIDGLRYHYLDEGTGPVLLMSHGNPTWSFYWRRLIQAWKNGYRVIVPDHMGCGLSDKPRDYEYTLRRHIDNLCTLVNDLDLRRITLFGHDWGGSIGMGAAAKMPERFSRFVLCNTAAFRSTRMPLRISACRIPLLGTLGVRGLNLFARAALWMATSKRERFTPDVRAGYLFPYDTWAHRVAIDRFVKDIPLVPSHPSYQTLKEVEEGLAQFRKYPLLLAWGMRDWCFSPHFLERFIEFFPEAEVRRYMDAGHWVVEDAWERLVPDVEAFFARHPLP